MNLAFHPHLGQPEAAWVAAEQPGGHTQIGRVLRRLIVALRSRAEGRVVGEAGELCQEHMFIQALATTISRIT